MDTYKVLIYSEEKNTLQKLKSSFELLPEDLVENCRFDVLTAGSISNAIDMIDQRIFDVIIIEHNDEGSNGFAVIDSIDKMFREKPNYIDTFARIILFIGPNDAKTVIRAFNHHLVTDYIIIESVKVKSLAKDVINKLKTKKSVKSETANTEHLVEIINYQDKLIDDLVLRIIEIASKINELKKQTGTNKVIYDEDQVSAIEIPDLDDTSNNETIEIADLNNEEDNEENRYKIFEQKKVYFLDIRISIDDSLLNVYLKYEIEVLYKLVLQFFSSYLEKYNSKKILISLDRFLYVFADEKALNCALELCARLAQIVLSEETVLNSFKFSIGIDCENLCFTDEIDDLMKKSDIIHLQKIMDNVKKDNTVYITHNVYSSINDKLKFYFKEIKLNNKINYYKYIASFGK